MEATHVTTIDNVRPLAANALTTDGNMPLMEGYCHAQRPHLHISTQLRCDEWRRLPTGGYLGYDMIKEKLRRGAILRTLNEETLHGGRTVCPK